MNDKLYWKTKNFKGTVFHLYVHERCESTFAWIKVTKNCLWVRIMIARSRTIKRDVKDLDVVKSEIEKLITI